MPYLGFVDPVEHRPLVLPAALSLAAAAIHFAFAGAHFDEPRHGLFFLAVGAYQSVWALAALVRPTPLVQRAALLNLGVVAVWAATRPDEGVHVPDALATVVELGIVALVVSRPRVPRALTAAVAVVVGAGTMVSLSPPFAVADHGHDERSHDERSHDEPGHHERPGPSEHAASHPAHPAPSAPTVPAAAAAGTTPCEAAGPPLSPAQVTVAEGHAHRGPVPQRPVDHATRHALAEQQQIARSVAGRYPTVAHATSRGYKKSTPFVPCIGAHYTNVGLAARFDPALPAELLFDGTDPDSKLVGLSYLVYHPGGPPEGFAGPNDVWHQHNANGGLCFDRTGFVLAGEEATAEECRELGGVKRELTDVWMLHDWIVPGWECSWGVFAPECPELGGKLGLSAWD